MSHSHHTVFVPNNKDYDLSDTERFGRIVAVTEGSVNIFNLPALRLVIKEKMFEAQEEDYLLMGGAPLINALCFGYMLLRFGRVNLLIFDAKTRCYELRTVSEQEVV